jgi:type IV pilus assembly protein PilW
MKYTLSTISPKTKAKQLGISLVELMVSMTIGLGISAGAAALFANMILSSRTLNATAQIQEVGTLLGNTVSRQIRMTGYSDWLENAASLQFITSASSKNAYNLAAASTKTVFENRYNQAALHGCDSGYESTAQLEKPDCITAVFENSLPKASAFTIAYQVRSALETGGAPSLPQAFDGEGGMLGDCNNLGELKQAGSTTVDVLYAINRYYLDTSTKQLYCKGNGGSAQPMASNVEQLTATYALAAPNLNPSNPSPTSDELVGAYQTAEAITTANAWARVISLRVCVVIAGEAGSLAKAVGTSVSAARNDCTGTALSLADGRLRQAFTSTIALRNQIHTANQLP